MLLFKKEREVRYLELPRSHVKLSNGVKKREKSTQPGVSRDVCMSVGCNNEDRC